MTLLRLTSLWFGTALATLTVPQPWQQPKPGDAEPAPPHLARPTTVRFLTSPPPARFDVGRGWSQTETRIEQDVEKYREQSSEQLESIGLAIEGLDRRCEREPFVSRPYLRTRVEALRQHLNYARGELIKLPNSQSDESFLPVHAHFYRTLTTLQDAFTQTADEMNDQS